VCPCASSGLISGRWISFQGISGVGRAGVAQLVEHLICNQRVGGSNPFASSTYKEEKETGPEKGCIGRRADFFEAPGLSSAVIPFEVHTPKCRRFSGREPMRWNGALEAWRVGWRMDGMSWFEVPGGRFLLLGWECTGGRAVNGSRL
jgi:hypothetical protein